MNIYIGLNFNGNPTSVLLADSREKADIAWMGMKEYPHTVEEIDPTNDDLGLHGVAFLLTSIEKTVTTHASNTTFRKWKRGL